MICLAYAGRQCAHDPGAGLITTDPHDAGEAMRGFPRQNISTVACSVEGCTQSGQFEDVAAGLLRNHSSDLRIDRSCPSPDRIQSVRSGTISRIHCGRDAALRPSRGCTFAQTLRGDHQHRMRREFQGGVLGCQPGAHDNDARRVDPDHWVSQPDDWRDRSCVAQRDGLWPPRKGRLLPHPACCAASTGSFPA